MLSVFPFQRSSLYSFLPLYSLQYPSFLFTSSLSSCSSVQCFHSLSTFPPLFFVFLTSLPLSLSLSFPCNILPYSLPPRCSHFVPHFTAFSHFFSPTLLYYSLFLLSLYLSSLHPMSFFPLIILRREVMPGAALPPQNANTST